MILMKRSARGSGAGVSMRELKQNIGFLGKEFRSVIGAKSTLFERYSTMCFGWLTFQRA
jgi:hypothetical protein